MDTDKKTECEGNACFGGKRYIFAVLAFFGLFVSHMNIVDLSVAIVAMVRRGEGNAACYSYLAYTGLSSAWTGLGPIQKRWIGEPEPDTGSVSKRTTKSICSIVKSIF